MPIVEALAEIVIESAAGKLLETAKREGWLTDLLLALRLKRRNLVLVLGTTGVGKTLLLDSLTNLMPKAIDRLKRTKEVRKRRIKLANEPFAFDDTPGEPELLRRRMQAYTEAVRKGKVGIINVVCDGYHEYGEEDVKRTAVTSDMKANPLFLENKRETEKKALQEWAFLGGGGVAKWMITVITKADLWWEERDRVLEYYRNGAYAKALGELALLTPKVNEYCCVRQRFFDSVGMSPNFDDLTRLRLRASLIKAILEAVGKGKSDGE